MQQLQCCREGWEGEGGKGSSRCDHTSAKGVSMCLSVCISVCLCVCVCVCVHQEECVAGKCRSKCSWVEELEEEKFHESHFWSSDKHNLAAVIIKNVKLLLMLMLLLPAPDHVSLAAAVLPCCCCVARLFQDCMKTDWCTGFFIW